MGDTGGVMNGQELRTVREVFGQIVSLPWFSRDIALQQDFGAFMIRTYLAGVSEAADLYDRCLEVARQRYKAPTAA